MDDLPEGIVDPGDVEEDQGGMWFRWKNRIPGLGDGESDANSIVREWIAQEESDDWQGRTNISTNQAAPIAFLANIDSLLPNATHDGALETMSDEVLEDYLEILTSIDGKSRKQQVEVLKNALDKGDSESQQINIGTDPDDDKDDD